jgi:hypothetical protein
MKALPSLRSPSPRHAPQAPTHRHPDLAQDPRGRLLLRRQDRFRTEALLWQTGYLTIDRAEELFGEYRYPIARYEGYYASVFYAYFASLGLDLTPEESSNAGRLDMGLRFNSQVYLFEFKVVELAAEGGALAQGAGWVSLRSTHPPLCPS